MIDINVVNRCVCVLERIVVMHRMLLNRIGPQHQVNFDTHSRRSAQILQNRSQKRSKITGWFAANVDARHKLRVPIIAIRYPVTEKPWARVSHERGLNFSKLTCIQGVVNGFDHRMSPSLKWTQPNLPK